jgi:hypothetical protein
MMDLELELEEETGHVYACGVTVAKGRKQILPPTL